MDVALNELGDGQFCMGEYHYSLVVFGEGVPDAGRRAAQAIGAVGEASSLQMSPVDLVADAAWFVQMPGNWQWRPRDAKLSSRAFAADIGITEQAWEVRVEEMERVRTLQSERVREEQLLDEELKEVLDDAGEQQSTGR